MLSTSCTRRAACASHEIKRMTSLHVRTLVPRNVHDAGTLVALYIDGHLVLRERLIIRRVVYIA